MHFSSFQVSRCVHYIINFTKGNQELIIGSVFLCFVTDWFHV